MKRSHCSRVLRPSRRRPPVLDLLGDAYTQTKDLAKAEDAYRRAAELEPSEPSHQRGLGQALIAEEKYPEALKVYQRLADLMPDDPDVYLRLGQIYRELRQMDKAEDTLVKARQYSPGSLDVIYNEAMLYQAQGRYEDAIRVLSEAVTQVKGQPASMPSRWRFLAFYTSSSASCTATRKTMRLRFTPTRNSDTLAMMKTAARAC